MITPCASYSIINSELSVDLKIKHDDLYPAVGGGNKARKARYIIDFALMHGFDSVATNGGLQSNHARAIALAAVQHGLKCSLILHSESPDLPKKPSGNLLLMMLSGAKIQFCRLDELSDAMDNEIENLKKHNLNPLYIWGGGHCLEGSLAFYDAAKETQQQCGDWIPDYVLHASGTGTTQAGLIAGYSHLPASVIGISIARPTSRGTQVISDSLFELGDYLKKDFTSCSIQFRDEWTCGGYEKTSRELLALIDKTAKTSLILDPTYTGKAFLGMKNLIKSGEIPVGSKILFWHTGGLLNLLSSDKYLSRNI